MMDARMMQTEFERRVTLMNDALNIEDKLTSDTIFSFLNAYTKRYVKQIYLSFDNAQQNSRLRKSSIDSIKSLLVRDVINKLPNTSSDNYTVSFSLPKDYFLYVRSNSLVTSTYKDSEITNPQPVVNELISAEDASKVITTPYNQIILRNPCVILYSDDDNTYLNVIHDKFTSIEQLDLLYYRLPKQFNVIGVDGVNVLNYCELPESTHMEIVEGAVEMFVTEAKYRLNLKQDKQ